MHLAVVTFHRAVNPGAFLQLLALQQVLNELGHTVEVIDWGAFAWFRKEFLSRFHSARGINRILRQRHLLSYYLLQQKHFQLSSPIRNARDYDWSRYDAIIFGSDEIWNVSNYFCGQSTLPFGVDVDHDRLIAYAPSVGALESANALPEVYANGLARFRHLSVRDEHSKMIISDIIGRNSAICCDPTLLCSFREELYGSRQYEDESKGSILIYTTQLGKSEFDWLQSFAKRRDLKLNFAGFWSPSELDPIIEPFRLLSCFRSARFIVTNTFHGITLAIKFGRPLLVLSDSEKSNKVRCTLERFNVNTKTLSTDEGDLEDLEDNSEWPAILEELRLRSIEYLTSALSGAE